MKEKKVKVEEKKVQPKSDKPNIFKRIGKKLKEVFSEIKKVSWPDKSKVIKQTSVVIGVVLCFMVVLLLIDLGLGELLKLLTSTIA
ncbi:MAG: preprotein translocase subunit SecE [Clostridia bacterium]|nr:preprotein translocase subunit SecE [Clostridia bacterium]